MEISDRTIFPRCNYCKYYAHSQTIEAMFDCAYRGACNMFPPKGYFTGYFPVFYNAACDHFVYSPIRNLYGIESPDYIEEWLEAHDLRDKLQMYQL